MHLPIQLDRTSSEPLQDQLFGQMRQLIVSGKIKPNARIIATRFLAEQVGISRTTMLLVYERLISEGYLKTQPTVGTFVCDVLPDIPTPKFSTESTSDEKIVRQARLQPGIFTPSSKHEDTPERPKGFSLTDFTLSCPDSSLLPSPKTWMNCIQSVLKKDGGELAKPVHLQGLPVLRQVLSDWLAARRGATIVPEQIVIVSGLRQAYAILAHMFQRRGDHVVIESTMHGDAIELLDKRQASFMSIPVDHGGMMTECLPRNSSVSFACVRPARETLLGGSLSISRRKELIEWARKEETYIIENDVDTDLRYQGTTPLPLIALDPYGLVFHVGSFSKTLGAGQCLGYIVAPIEFVGATRGIKAMSDDGCSWLEQRMLAEFIAEGHYDQHLRRLRRTLMTRRDCLIQSLESHFGPQTIFGNESGTQLTWILPSEFSSAALIQKTAQSFGIDLIIPTDKGNLCDRPSLYEDRALVFSYAALAERQIKDGIEGLAKVLKYTRFTFKPLPTMPSVSSLQKRHVV